MGYEPDPMLQALNRYRRRQVAPKYHGTLAWITDKPMDKAMNPNPAFYEAAKTWAARKGYRFEPIDATDKGMSPSRIRSILVSRGIRGILLPPRRRSETRLEMDLFGFSVVTIGNTLISPDLHRVGPAQFENARELAQWLFREWGERVGFYLPRGLDERTDGKFSAGFLRAQLEMPVKKRIPPFLPDEYNEKEFCHWFKKHPMDVLITSPQPVLEWFGRMGVECPKDVRIAFPGDPTHPGASAWITENWIEIYQAAVDYLISKLEHDQTGVPEHPNRILVRGELATAS
jgi:DNA-binding LacI/PurR family transcriptional regulator